MTATAGEAFERIPEVKYVKMPGEVFDMIMTCETQGQQDKLFGAYCREFMTGNPGKLPKSIRPLFALVKSIADRIKSGILTGSIRHDRGAANVDNHVETPREVGKKSATSREEVGKKSGRSLEEVGNSSPRSKEHSGGLPAETPSTPQTPPKTQYTYTNTDINKDLETDTARPAPYRRPTREEWQEYADEIGPEKFASNAGAFYEILEGRGFNDGEGGPIKDWRAYARSIARRFYG